MESTVTPRWIFGLSLVAGLLVAGPVARPATQAPSVDEETPALERKFATILQNAASSERPVPPVIVLESEANAYLLNEGSGRLPDGVTDPNVVFEDSGRVSTRATVDLGVVSAARSRGALDPLRYLTGRLPVTAAGFLRTDEGAGHVEIDSVRVAGFPVPHSVLREIVRQYTKSDAYPDGVELTEPFELPYRIREVRVRSAELVVEQ